MMLAHRFLKPNGTVAAVLPLTTFTGRAFERLVQFLVGNYTVKTIVLGLGRPAFSEDTRLTECLFVAEKRGAQPGHKLRALGVLKDPADLNQDDVDLIAEAYESGEGVEGLVKVLDIEQEALLPEGEKLAGIISRLQKGYRDARRELDAVAQNSSIPLVEWGELRKLKRLKVNRWVLGSEHLGYYGSEALLPCRSEDRALKDIDRLVFDGEDAAGIRFRDLKAPDHVYTFPKDAVVPAIRRFSYLTSIDVTGQTDFAISRPVPALGDVMKAFYGKDRTKVFISRIRKRTKKLKGGKWPSRVLQGSSRLCFGRRFDLAARGTIVLATRQDEPTFLACDGFMVKGLSPPEEKLFCLWMNSSLFLTWLMSKLTVTRGTWVKLEKSFVDRIPFPDFDELDEKDWSLVEELYEELRAKAFPNLMEQLKEHPVRRTLDEGMLLLLGVKDPSERARIGTALRGGARMVLEALEKSMKKKRRKEA